ncbi:MAG: hypothetical protein IT338_15275, partial [Thermomicrobiales bacterium]|nr:hypothetical protein [Thermomicrobiales bacterium]
MNGARAGVLTWPRRLLSRAIAHDLAAFVIPDVRLVRAAGLDPEAAGLALATTPRHATLLLLVGPVPDRLAAAASVTYAQMPRPRSILAVGVSAVPGLPEPDVVTRLDQGALRAAVVEVRRRLAAGAFSPEAPVFEITAVETRTEYVCPMHPEIVRPEPGSCPICGMDLVPRETVGPTGLSGHDHPSPADHAAPAPRVRDSDPTAFTCPMHPEARAAAPGRCPICGMRLVPASSVTDHAAREHEPGSMAEHGRHERAEVQRGAHGDHGPRRAGHEAPAAGDALAHGHGVERGATGQDATNHAAMDHGEHHGHVSPPPADDERVAPAPAIGHTAMEHGDRGHDTMNHAAHGGGFMSMVAMTRDLPRSDDGLPMEWIDVPFGPLFPGLPGGLDLTFTLDGDGVARAVVTEATARGLEATWAGPASTFPGRLAHLDPLAPVAYRLLARMALETVAGAAVDPAIATMRIREAEWERIVNHLGWLAEFGFLIGDQWLAASAATLQVAAARTGAAGPGALIGAMRRFVARVPRVPLLDRRLEGIGESA